PAQRLQTADAFRNALKSAGLAPSASQPVAAVPSEAPTLETILPPLSSQSAVTATPLTPASLPLQSQGAQGAIPIPLPLPQPGGHRGLYVTLGALIVLAVLVAAGIYMPRGSKTQAKVTPAESQSDAAQMASTSPQETAQPPSSTVPTPGVGD